MSNRTMILGLFLIIATLVIFFAGYALGTHDGYVKSTVLARQSESLSNYWEKNSEGYWKAWSDGYDACYELYIKDVIEQMKRKSTSSVGW